MKLPEADRDLLVQMLISERKRLAGKRNPTFGDYAAIEAITGLQGRLKRVDVSPAVEVEYDDAVDGFDPHAIEHV